ncbi:putative phosphatidylserine decarboxylase [Lyophyllum shimeji]|uniref:Phosphatidylserine decarboxylase n=1 Tax=Lyophyllum shimeji TaxID=47721 RepID=A0A9P3PWU8_LYOSH|nr:putative phosphatidylserine decarboxylase [Lyophyllum shimeji]
MLIYQTPNGSALHSSVVCCVPACSTTSIPRRLSAVLLLTAHCSVVISVASSGQRSTKIHFAEPRKRHPAARVLRGVLGIVRCQNESGKGDCVARLAPMKLDSSTCLVQDSYQNIFERMLSLDGCLADLDLKRRSEVFSPELARSSIRRVFAPIYSNPLSAPQGRMATEPVVSQGHGWLPHLLERWLAKKVQEVDAQTSPVQFAPVVKEFQELIEGDESLRILFTQMFTQVPNKPPFDKDPTQKPQVRDYMTMLTLFNKILTEAPEFGEYPLVSFPICAILNWPMGTPAGLAAFALPSVNAMLRKMLAEWSKFLASPASCYVLTSGPGGWFSEPAMKAMGNFDADFIFDATKPYHGFTSWDDFFTRRLKPGRRPVPGKHDPSIVISACEASVYNHVSNVQEHDLFCIKETSYSLSDMLANHPYTPQFINGTVYQAYLAHTQYHRWHTPVNGTVLETQLVPGTYYSQSPIRGIDPSAPSALRNCQGYLTAVATRAMIYIQADNPSIGLMCFMAVGMAEVSSCEIAVQKGAKVVQGDELGTFHYGGSTYCLIFRPETKIQFADVVKVGSKIKLNEPIAFVAD